ncbi:hypothetical protein, partial [uncultured Paracoccus sp.]|uniref:hypothetical protein n=1 Tax=uncultured Paracoccus sp. TaxID=189685 RepID=UPI0025F948F9
MRRITTQLASSSFIAGLRTAIFQKAEAGFAASIRRNSAIAPVDKWDMARAAWIAAAAMARRLWSGSIVIPVPLLWEKKIEPPAVAMATPDGRLERLPPPRLGPRAQDRGAGDRWQRQLEDVAGRMEQLRCKVLHGGFPLIGGCSRAFPQRGEKQGVGSVVK